MKINISYKQKFIKNKTTEQVIDAFGLGKIKENIIIKDFDFKLEPLKI